MRDLIVRCDGCGGVLEGARDWQANDLPIAVEEMYKLDLCMACQNKFKKLLLLLKGKELVHKLDIYECTH